MILKINLKDEAKIEAKLEGVQARARARTFSKEEIYRAVKNAENRLEGLGIAKKNWLGCKIKFYPEQVNSNSYPYHGRESEPKGTYLTVERCASGWFLVTAYRGVVGKSNYREAMELELSDLARQGIKSLNVKS